MVQALELFAHGVSSEGSFQGCDIRIRYVGDRWARPAIEAFARLGWRAAQHDLQARLEFFSLQRESHEGVFIEEIPHGWQGELVQRLLAASFQGLRPRGILFIGFREHPVAAVLAWLRQAGFEALQQGQSEGLQAVLARRLG